MPRRKSALTDNVNQLETFAPKELPDTVSINVPLPRDLHRRLRIRALTDELTLTDAVAQAIEDWVA